jgi:hypothetical protein
MTQPCLDADGRHRNVARTGLKNCIGRIAPCYPYYHATVQLMTISESRQGAYIRATSARYCARTSGFGPIRGRTGGSPVTGM